MTAAKLLEARGQVTDNPYFGAISMANAVNHALGGQYVAPWEAWQLPEEWLDACLAKADVPALRANMKEMDDYVAEWKRNAMKRQ